MSKMLDKTEPFRVLQHNPYGARYEQDGELYNCGGRPVARGGEQEVEQSVDVAPKEAPRPEGTLQCPHCDHAPYRDERWLKRHIAAEHSDV